MIVVLKSEVVSLVQRIESKGLPDEFSGTVDAVKCEPGFEGRMQYCISIIPSDVDVSGSATQRLWEWYPMSATCSEEGVPNGSVMERILTQIEIVLPAAKKAKTLSEAFNLLVGRKLRFQRIKLGRDFDGHAAKEYIVPVARLD